MSQTFHVLCAGDEQVLLESAVHDLPEIALLERAGDDLFRIAQEATVAGPPDDVPAGWGASSNGVLAAAAMALRTGRAIGLLVCSGYGIETAGLVRRLGEITQHAGACAQDPTGTYAWNWGKGAGKAAKPSSAYMQGVTDADSIRKKWSFLSRLEHANLTPYLNVMCSKNERGEIVHPVAPARHEAADAIALSSAAWDLARTAAAVCKTHAHLDATPTLELAQELLSHQTVSDVRIDAWMSTHQADMQPDAP